MQDYTAMVDVFFRRWTVSEIIDKAVYFEKTGNFHLANKLLNYAIAKEET